MTEKPSYLGLLNAISNAEGEAQCYLSAWAAVTPRDDVKAVISTVALREGEHSLAFAKRMCELGFDVVPRSDGKNEERLAVASSSTLSDLEKFEKLELGEALEPGRADIFAGMFADSTIDIQTGALLGRYIAEERDSGRMFRDCRLALEADSGRQHGAASNGGTANGHTANAAADRLDSIEQLLCKVLEKLGS